MLFEYLALYTHNYLFNYVKYYFLYICYSFVLPRVIPISNRQTVLLTCYKTLKHLIAHTCHSHWREEITKFKTSFYQKYSYFISI